MTSVQGSSHLAKAETGTSDESDDSDFAASLSSVSDSEAEGKKRLKRKAGSKDVDSGDEKVIEEGGRKLKKRSKKDAAEVDEGVGARLRKRKDGRDGDQERKPIMSTEDVSIDVDKIWAQMNSAEQPIIAQSQSTVKTSLELSKDMADSHNTSPQGHQESTSSEIGLSAATAPADEEVITIKRTYAFAGETITEEKTVPKSSAEARLFLQTQSTGSDHTSKTGTKPPLRRPKKRASMFDPSSGQTSNVDKGKGPKLNTIEKSKLDWAGYVDQEGIKDELDGAKKSKDGYLGKKDFLERVDAKRDLEILSAKKR